MINKIRNSYDYLKEEFFSFLQKRKKGYDNRSVYDFFSYFSEHFSKRIDQIIEKNKFLTIEQKNALRRIQWPLKTINADEKNFIFIDYEKIIKMLPSIADTVNSVPFFHLEVADYSLPRLKELRETYMGIPASFYSDQKGMDISAKLYEQFLDNCIESFEEIKKGNIVNQKENLRSFYQNLLDLWD